MCTLHNCDYNALMPQHPGAVFLGKIMKPQELYKGIKVVATDLPNATVYTVKAIKNFTVELIYTTENGKTVAAGVLDACFLKLPTIQQLSNS